MTKVVLDTNVLISGLFWKCPSCHIIDLAIANKIESITSAEILEELEAVLSEDFPSIPYARIEEIVRDIFLTFALGHPNGIMKKPHHTTLSVVCPSSK